MADTSAAADPSKAHPTNMASKFSFLEATVMRRSTVDLKKDSTIPDARIIEIVNHSILHTPSPFHVQSTRAVVMLHADHEKLWDMIYTHAEKNYPAEMFQGRIVPNLKSFRGSHATVSEMSACLFACAVWIC